MYIRTPRAYCWRDELPAAELAPPLPSTLSTSLAPIRWAKYPWPSKAGRLMAVRLVLDEVQVGVRSTDGRLHWMTADNVLTSHEARRWASGGF